MSEERARYQHYHFVHDYLRDKCLGSPMPALKDFFHEKATEHLKIAWVSLGMLYKDRDEEFIQPEGIEVVPFEIGDKFKGAILVFPKPERLNEAFMSAIVAPHDIQIGDTGKSRYFTLEYNPDRPIPHTYIGQWTDGAHFNLGDGPVPTADNFKQAIVELVAPSTEEDEVDNALSDDEEIDYRGLVMSALAAWDRIRDEALLSGSLAGVDAEILNQLLFHHPEVESLNLRRGELQMSGLKDRFLEEFNAAYFKVDPALVEDPTSDLAIETVANYAISKLSDEALESGDSKLAENIQKLAPNLIEGLKEVSRKNHRTENHDRTGSVNANYVVVISLPPKIAIGRRIAVKIT